MDPQLGTAVFGNQSIVGASDALLEAIAMARRMASTHTPSVLISGEAGTGKALFARGIHNAGPAPHEPFVVVNCAALPESLLETELFGQEPGVDAGASGEKKGLLELAGAGTLFLAEVSELPPRLQPKLLRVLEERTFRRLGGFREIEVRCRVLATSKMPLEDAVARDAFRADLFYLLDAFQLRLPPLRARSGDIELLARHFLAQGAQQRGGEARELTPAALSALQGHAWPGNVRELKIVVERAAILSEDVQVRPEHLMIQHRLSRSAASATPLFAAEIRIPPQGKSLDEIEREAIALTLQLTQGNQSATARVLGISRPTLARKMLAYGLRSLSPGPES